MRVGIVGAGIAGLAASRHFKRRGIESVVFEKSKAYGGRCATRRLGEYIFDTGATSIAPRGRSLGPVMLQELDQSDLVKIELPIFVHDGIRTSLGDPHKNRVDRYTYRSGINKLGKLLAEGVDIRFEQKIETLEKHSEGRYRLLGEEFDALILTPPIPQTAELLASIGEFRPINNVRFRSCLSVLMGFEKTQEFKCHAMIEPEQRHPMTWLSIESAKSPGRAPDGCTALVAQLSPSYSQNHYDSPDEAIVRDTIQYVGRVLGSGWDAPAVSDVKRWRYSQPEMTAMYETVNPSNSRILIAGDGVLGSRVEYAFESGLRAAKQLLGEE